MRIHFGIYDRNGFPEVDGHDDPNVEHEFRISRDNYTAWVSGSWQCWGPADQDSDGDKSLHVMVELPDHLLTDAPSLPKLAYIADDLRYELGTYHMRDSHNVTISDFMPVTDSSDHSTVLVVVGRSGNLCTPFKVEEN